MVEVNVNQSFSELLTHMRNELEKIKQKMSTAALNLDLESLDLNRNIAESMSTIIESVISSQKSWNNYSLIGVDNDSFTKKEAVEDRTTWEELDGTIRVITRRKNSNKPYSNVIPKVLFIKIAEVADEFVNKNGHVKTSDVVSALDDTIHKNSGYSSESSINIPVYASFKVLYLTGYLVRESASKYLRNKEVSLVDIINTTDTRNRVTFEEAIKKLILAGKHDMATGLENWKAKKGSSQGFDGSVIGEKGELYTQFGPEMREIIWPNRFKLN
ncbi:hypothetical protein [Paenibacillus sp. FSL K6-2859]|uniref:hypothetical protein n=1 Tax=Paenibacillus sp. FSL K6-2859 TaxID=2921482 RepID=UPI0030F95B7C